VISFLEDEYAWLWVDSYSSQANPKLASQRDDDERLPIHWAVSYGHLDVALLLAQKKEFDPDVQDSSGWTPLMIAVSLKEGDDLVNLLLNKGADINQTSKVHHSNWKPPS
jgi:26S proteasome non-ATPase regulatory subunit 10